MQVSVEKTGDLERKMTVQVPAGNIDSKVSGRLNELRGQVRLKGFRPGRVPMNIIRQRYGDQVRDEILQEVMQSSLQEAIGENNLRVAGVTRLEPQPQEGADFEFTAELEVFPEVPQIEVADLTLEKPQAEVAEEDVDGMLTTLQEQRRSWTPVERAAADGDRVHLAYVTELDGERIPNTGQSEIYPVLGQLSAFSELEDLLQGCEAGQEKEAELNFPASWQQGGLAGRTAPVKLSIKAVEEAELPPIDDEFAASFGVEGGVDQLRADVRRNMERELRQALSNRIKREVTDRLIERYKDMPLPPSAVNQELQVMQNQFQQQTGQQPPPADQFRDSAEKRVRLGLLLAEIARQHDISIDPARVQARIQETAETYDQPAQVVEMYRSEPRLMDQVENLVLEEQVIDWVLENGQISNKVMSFSELMGQ